MTAGPNTGAAGSDRIGFTCAYAPLPLFRAAGFVPYRLLPLGEAPDRAGSVLHDNMCPHVKRVLDRAMDDGLPELAGFVVMNSCDTMRRLADAWRALRPHDRVTVVELPTVHCDLTREFLETELGRLRELLGDWTGHAVEDEAIEDAIRSYDELAHSLATLGAQWREGGQRAGRAALQELYNLSVTEPVEIALRAVRNRLTALEQLPAAATAAAVPLFLFGNVLPDPAAFDLFESCGGRVVGDDLCTGERQLVATGGDTSLAPLARLARALLERPHCARTLPGPFGARDLLAEQIVSGARASGARGVVAHVMKFCDPYLARLPAIGRRLESEGLPLLILEGDCTTRSLGQQTTRIEAFVEMLGEM